MKRLGELFAAALLLALGAPAQAQEKFPSRPIRLITAFAPGSATDIIARLLAEQLRQELGQNIIVENKPGAFGIVAIEEMARSRPDGHTLMLGNISTTVLTPLLYRKKFSINPETDVAPISRIGILPSFWAVSARVPVHSLREFIEYAKQRPGKIFYATNGVGSFPHYDSEILARRAGIEMAHVPVKGGPPDFMKDMATGDVHAAFINVASAGPFIKSAQIRPLATTAEQRLPEYPDVPTMAELGFPGVGSLLWSAVTAPGATPHEVLEALNGAVRKSLGAPTLQESFKKQLVIPAPSGTVPETKQWLEREFAHWTKIMQEVKIDVPE